MLICLTAMSVADDVSCSQGDQKQQQTPTPSNTPLDGVATSGGISADPNEIIGPAGYDSIHWVNISDVLNYTILFENDLGLLSTSHLKDVYLVVIDNN